MSLDQNNSESSEPSDTARPIKNEIKESLDETFGPLLLQIAKMIKEISETTKSQISFNEIMAAKVNMVYSLQSELQGKLLELDSISAKIERLDKSLGKFLQKSIQDMKKIEEKIATTLKPEQVAEPPVKISDLKDKIAKVQEEYGQKEKPVLVDNGDKDNINNLIVTFSNKEIYTTEALRLIESTRDKLLFERDEEVRYRAYAAKIFREILAIAKQEKDFSTLSSSAAEDIKKLLKNLLDHI